MKYSEKTNVLNLLLKEERAAILGDIVPGVGTGVRESAKAMRFVVESVGI